MIIDPEVAVDRWLRGGPGSKAAAYAYNKITPSPRVPVTVAQGKKRVKYVKGQVIWLAVDGGKAVVRTVKTNGDSEAQSYSRDKIKKFAG